MEVKQIPEDHLLFNSVMSIGTQAYSMPLQDAKSGDTCFASLKNNPSNSNSVVRCEVQTGRIEVDLAHPPIAGEFLNLMVVQQKI